MYPEKILEVTVIKAIFITCLNVNKGLSLQPTLIRDEEWLAEEGLFEGLPSASEESLCAVSCSCLRRCNRLISSLILAAIFSKENKDHINSAIKFQTTISCF